MSRLEIPAEFEKPPVIDFRVITIEDWDSVLAEGSGIGPWDNIIQLDSEYTVTDGLTGETVPAVSGTVQDKEQTIGIFEIRPASGLLIGIDFNDTRICHKVWATLESVGHFGNGGSREEWWAIPLEYGIRAEGASYISDGDTWKTFELHDKSLEDVQDYLFNTGVLELDKFDDQVYLSDEGKLFLSETNFISSLPDLAPISQLLEKHLIREERRNDNRSEFR